MALAPGSHELGPSAGRLLVRTRRAGFAAAAGHDLVLEARRWSARLAVADSGDASLGATVDARSLEVTEASGGVKPLTERDHADIARNMAQAVLRSDRHRDITFASTSVTPVGDDRLAVAGDLTIAGAVRPVQFTIEVHEDAGLTRLRARVALRQSEWGIRPFSALLGTLKVADAVEVQAEAQLR
jgi:polyisoprenoid-binding protein YceI